jgi:hypothetical protein
MNKQRQNFRKIAEYKARFRKLSSEILTIRLFDYYDSLHKEAVIALREVLEERKQQEFEESLRDKIRLIYHLTELHGSCYFEILPGIYKGKCWSQNSVFMNEEVFGYLEPIFEYHVSDFDHYAFIEISRDDWMLIIDDFTNLLQVLDKAQNINDLIGKVGFIFKDSIELFESNFSSNTIMLANTIRHLSEWVTEQLKSQDYISILGI